MTAIRGMLDGQLLPTPATKKEQGMKGHFKALVSVFLLLLLSLSAFSEELATNLDARVLESFDDDPTSRWIVRGSKFTRIVYDENDQVVEVYPKVAEVPGYPAALHGIGFKDEEGALKVLGIKGSFTRKGYNYVEIIPAREADAATPEEEIIYEDVTTGKRWVHAPLELPGRVQYFDAWVWGSNHEYEVYAHFEDHRGVDHEFRMGSLNYPGWKNLRTIIPGTVPMSTRYLPKFKPLTFTKFVVWTSPAEVVEEFYVYFDHVKVLTDLFEARFDGDDLVSPALLEQVWGSDAE